MLNCWMHPTRLYALLAILILGYFWVWIQKKNQQRCHQFSNTHIALSPLLSPTKKRLSCLFILLSISLLILAAARPRWGYKERQDKEGINIVIAVDISRSMLVLDGQAHSSRLQTACHIVQDILNTIPGQDRVGLITFSHKANLICPGTTDRDALQLVLGELQADLGTTYLSSAMILGKEMLERLEPSQAKILIVISDGGETAETLMISDEQFKATTIAENQQALQLAKDLAKSKITCLWIGVGSTEYHPIPTRHSKEKFVRFQIQGQSQIIQSKRNDAFLQTLSNVSSGVFIPFQETSQSLPVILQTIEQYRHPDSSSTSQQDQKDQFYWFVLLALILLFLETSFVSRKATR